MTRFIDLILAAFGLLLGSPLLVTIFIFGLFDTGNPLFFQQRVGRFRKAFTLVKFRTMALDTASVGTHLVDSGSVTKLGKFLRASKLDELPQLWNVLKGEMSLVGPRPCLFNQEMLIDERGSRDVFSVRPGITGLAQINGIDMSDPVKLAKWDARMIRTMNTKNYFKYILLTFIGRGIGDRIVTD